MDCILKLKRAIAVAKFFSRNLREILLHKATESPERTVSAPSQHAFQLFDGFNICALNRHYIFRGDASKLKVAKIWPSSSVPRTTGISSSKNVRKHLLFFTTASSAKVDDSNMWLLVGLSSHTIPLSFKNIRKCDIIVTKIVFLILQEKSHFWEVCGHCT